VGLMDWLPGERRRLQRIVDRLDARFAEPELDRAARDYADALQLALRQDPPRAVELWHRYDARIPGDRYALAFRPDVEGWLTDLARRPDGRVLDIVFELATRLGLGALQREVRDRSANMLAGDGDANLLVSHLVRWHRAGLLNADTVSRTLRGHLARTPLDHDRQLWSSFFDQLPETLLPDLFDVHHFLGRGADAVRLADSPAREQAALDCCARSPRLADVEAGLALAQRREDRAHIRALQERAGDLLFEAQRYSDALPRYREADRQERVSECLERLGRFAEALDECPPDPPDRLADLAGRCRPAVDGPIERLDFEEAARQVRRLVGHLQRAAQTTAAVAARREEYETLRAVVRDLGRLRFGELCANAASSDSDNDSDSDTAAVRSRWSRFEEDLGELAEAARQSESAGDRYRAHQMYQQAGRPGDAVRVLRDDDSPQGLVARAEACLAGDDPVGAALLFDRAGQPERAVTLFERAGDLASAARTLVRWRGDDAVEDPRLAGWLRRTGNIEELTDLCLRATRRGRPGAPVLDELNRLYRDEAVPAHLQPEVRAVLESLESEGRRPFEARAQAWVAQARAETDRRFAGIWGLDLGTTTCAAAIYDTVTRRPVLCPSKGQEQFAATLSVDKQGNEVVGLSGEEIFAGWVAGHVSAAKRRIGSRTAYRIGERSYRPEEVAARLIRHARGLVETLLADHVRERVGELARAELGEVRDDWLSWVERHYDLRLSRPRVILTIPANFFNNQKHATRHACEIAGVEAVRLVHEPTAACINAARERRLSGRVVVVDLGAGTLDMSFLEVQDNLYEVQQVQGDNRFGGKDLDAAITAALATRLEEQDVRVPQTGVARLRLEVAAEFLKVALSSREHAEYVLRGFAGSDVRVELTRAELAGILAVPLRTLREAATHFRDSMAEQPQRLVLVGGPMLAPMVRELVEAVFGLTATRVADPRTAVAGGAALQAAVLDGKLEALLLLDVTPLPLGIRVAGEEDTKRGEFDVLIAQNTTIPIEQRRTYTTVRDNQPSVDIEIFNGLLDDDSRIGHFRLDGILPAPKGKPKIEVTFAIDTSCVLKVTAEDKATKRSRSIRLTDTTLLSPGEVDAMTRRYQHQRELDELHQRLAELVREAGDGDTEAAWREFSQRLYAHRPSPTADADTQRTLAEMFAGATDLEVELLLAQGPLSDLAGTARAYLDRPRRPDLEAELAEGRHLETELDRKADRLRPLRQRLATWNNLLVRLAVAVPEPLPRFRALYDAGDYARALATLAEVPGPLIDPIDLRRHLHCLAGVGDADGYCARLVAYAEPLRAVLLEPDRPADFLERTHPALARVGTGSARGGGFLVSDRLVVTNQHWLADRGEAAPADRIVVELDTGNAAVERVFVPERHRTGVAVLRLAEAVPVTPLRLGHPKLVRIGDRVWAAARRGGQLALVPGIVDRFESFAEHDLHVFKTDLRPTPECGGGPLLNDLGEVVGILAVREGEAAGTYALTIDALDRLLADAGFDRYG
jgi:molecular chaperone DnaK